MINSIDNTAGKNENAEATYRNLIEARNSAEQDRKTAETATSQQEFSSNTKQDIKASVNEIIKFTKELLKTDLDDTQIKYFNAIQSSCNTLVSLLKDNVDGPQKAPETPSGITSKEHENRKEKINVLVAEDVLLNQLLMKNIVEEFGFNMKIVPNGKNAVDELQKKHYDIVLMDLQMPEMNGFEATEHIRNTMHSQIPIIALTASVTVGDVEKCKAVGMNDFVEKPVDEKILYKKIMKQLKSSVQSKSKGVEVSSTKNLNKYVNLDYLKQRTKNNSGMIAEMIEIYLRETPKLVNRMKESRDNMDWESLAAAAHAIIPSFTIMGIGKNYEHMTRTIQENAVKKEKSAEINELVLKIEHVCDQACKELKNELKNIKQPPVHEATL